MKAEAAIRKRPKNDASKFADYTKLNDLSPMDYLTHVFRQLMEGNKDYESLLPGKLALQTI